MKIAKVIIPVLAMFLIGAGALAWAANSAPADHVHWTCHVTPGSGADGPPLWTCHADPDDWAAAYVPTPTPTPTPEPQPEPTATPEPSTAPASGPAPEPSPTPAPALTTGATDHTGAGADDGVTYLQDPRFPGQSFAFNPDGQCWVGWTPPPGYTGHPGC